ncbi:MAG: hypothetical protein ACK4K9_10845 [Bacteroidia bacterium]
MAEYLIKVIIVLLWSAFKFVVGFSTAVVFGFNQLEIVIITVSGAMLGVTVYLYLWDLLLNIYHKFFPKKQKPVKFSKLKRKLVVIIRKYEVWGIAFLSPILLSMPVGTILASTIEHNKWRIKFIMFSAVCFWVVVLIGIKVLFKIDIENLKLF